MTTLLLTLEAIVAALMLAAWIYLRGARRARRGEPPTWLDRRLP